MSDPKPVSRRNALFVGLAAGATALAAGGVAFTGMNWATSKDIPAYDFRSGNLDLDVKKGTAKDVSGDVEDHTWTDADEMVPGDTVQFTGDVTIALSGRHMVAVLGLPGDGDALKEWAGVPEAARQYVSIAASLKDKKTGDVIQPVDGKFRFRASNADAAFGGTPVELREIGADTQPNFEFVLAVTLAYETPNRELVQSTLASIQGKQVPLEQVRDGAGFTK